ncbi:hypothetical protein AB0N14_11230, partial [Streptomyces sp. NPDC051104]
MQKTEELAEDAESAVAVPAAPERAPARGWPAFWPLLLAAAVLAGPALLLLGRWMDAPAMQAWRTEGAARRGGGSCSRRIPGSGLQVVPARWRHAT